MIDTVLKEKAKKSSNVIWEIDRSWRDRIRDIENSNYKLPFTGEYSCYFKENNTFVEGYAGALLIDRVYYDHKFYTLKTPLKRDLFKLYAAFDNVGKFINYFSKPEYGVHYLGMCNLGHAVCIGDITHDAPESLLELISRCQEIIKSLRTINMESVGNILLDKDNDGELIEAFDLCDEDTGEIIGSSGKVEYMLENGMITECEKILDVKPIPRYIPPPPPIFTEQANNPEVQVINPHAIQYVDYRYLAQQTPPTQQTGGPI